MKALSALFVYSFLLSFLRTSSTLDTITPSQSIRDGETLVSASGIYELGFFSPGSSKSRYVGIWFGVSNDTVVWVANRETPLKNHHGVFKVTNKGILVLLDSTNTTIWSSNISRTAGNKINNPTAQLLDSGNLVVKDGNNSDPKSFLWQSFDHPSDTLLPEMKIGWDSASGLDRYLTAWKSPEDPAQGEFSGVLDRRGLPQVVCMQGDKIKGRPGSWNGLYFTGKPWLRPNPLFKYEFVLNEKAVYYNYKLLNNSILLRYVLNSLGNGLAYRWMARTQSWDLLTSYQADECQNYGHCGAYASCNVNESPVCACLKGFIPKSPKDWNSAYWSGGCVRGTPLGCNNGDGFLKYKGVKLPDTSSSWFDRNMNLKECEELCLKNCSCRAYANLDIRNGGSGCLLWFADLVDLVVLQMGGQDLYIRVAASELGNGLAYRWMARTQSWDLLTSYQADECQNYGHCGAYASCNVNESPVCACLKGFIPKSPKDWNSAYWSGGCVRGTPLGCNNGDGFLKYKGVKLPDTSSSWFDRNMNLKECEELCLKNCSCRAYANLDIRNGGSGCLLWFADLVDLVVLQMGGQDLYIRVAASELDQIEKNRHFVQKYQVTIIVCSAILLTVMLALGLVTYVRRMKLRKEGMNITRQNDYNNEDKKEDMELPIFDLITISNATDNFANNNKLGEGGFGSVYKAWKLWIEDKPTELIDEFLVLGDSCILSEVLRCIHVGLLCVQQRPEDRPNMSSVVLMLSSDNSLPNPRQPGFVAGKTPLGEDSSSGNLEMPSINEVTITVLEAR
nr:g-type lectin s-receptor-like serine/threonine-protein kinase [Quercus suber]